MEQILEVEDDREEGRALAARIRVRQKAGTPLSDMAVLFRTVRQGRNTERALVGSCDCRACHPRLLSA